MKYKLIRERERERERESERERERFSHTHTHKVSLVDKNTPAIDVYYMRL